MATTKTFTIQSRGRKYFGVLIGTHRAKLLINGASEGLSPGETVTAEVNDLSVRSRYGANLIFEPVEIMTAEDAAERREAAAALREAEKWLGYAEADTRAGRDHTKAIKTALDLCRSQPGLAERLAALREGVARNAAAAEAQRQEWRAERARRESAQAERRQRRTLYPVAQRPALHLPTRLHGGGVVFEGYGKAFRIDESHSSAGGYHLLGHEGEPGCYCYYRPATEEEVAQLVEQEEAAARAAQARQERSAEIAALADQIRETGEKPDGWHRVEGERVLNTQDAYGGGAWFVIGDDYIWHIVNNGGDGDDWSVNNVVTGGAGAIGYRIPFAAEIAERLRRLEASQ